MARRRIVAATVCLALVGGGASVGASAAPIESEDALHQVLFTRPSADSRSPSVATGDNLQVTIGKTVAVTTDQSGNNTPFNIMLVNGQISGQGSGQVDIPMGPAGDKTVNFNSTSGEVKNFFDFGGFYTGDMPVTIKTELKVNGESVDPNQGYDLNGDVEVTYQFTNHTSRKQEISYKNIYGTETKKEVDVPVPFGASFATTFGPGWSVRDAKGMTMQTRPTGAQLAATVILFPILEGVVGGTTQSLTINATAENASLPPTKSTVVPIDLSTYQGGLALKAVPMVQEDLLSPINSMLGGAIGQITSAAQLISGYAGALQTLDTGYIQPVIDEIESVKVNPQNLYRDLDSLGRGLDRFAGLMAANDAAQQQIGAMLTDIAKIVGVDTVKIVDWFATAIKQAGPKAQQAAKGLRGLNKVMAALDAGKLTTDAATLKQTCDVVGPTSEFYGFLPLTVTYVVPIPITDGSPGANALQQVIKDNTPWIGQPPQWVKNLTKLQTQLNTQSSQTLLPSILSALLPQYEDLKPWQKALLQAPACETVGALVTDLIVPLAGEWNTEVAPKVKDLALILDVIADFAASPLAKKIHAVVDEDLGKLSKVLSNDKCTPADIIDPLIAAIEKYGAAGIARHLVDVLKEVFSRGCGIAQIIEFFGAVDGVIGKAAAKFATLIDSAKSDVPVIVDGVEKVQGLADVLGSAVAGIPGLADMVAGKIAGAGEEGETMGDEALTKISDFAGQLGATLDAMSARTTAGDGAPYGGAKGPDTETLAAYQITMQEASPYGRTWAVGVVLSVVFLIVAVGVGTFLYRRHRAK